MTDTTIRVDLADRSYEVRIGAGLLEMAGEVIVGLGRARRAVVITDSTVGPLYAERLAASLEKAGLSPAVIEFPAGEASKTLATYSFVMDGLLGLAPAIDRHTVIVALGGGVASDLAGFVAATALRGLRWVGVPTTLLADVDASVGGKTAVDHAAGKNLIGAFHQPSGVLIDVETLASLPRGEMLNGLAECVKHAAIREKPLLGWIEAHAEAILAGEADVLGELIARNVAIKAAVVAGDERESGRRAHLNFGHTVGHAIETCLGLGTISHGQGVSLGMIAANAIALSRGQLARNDADRLEAVLGRLGLPIRWDKLPVEAIWRTMQHDKKAAGGRVRMVLARRLGEVEIADDIALADVKIALDALAGAK